MVMIIGSYCRSGDLTPFVFSFASLREIEKLQIIVVRNNF